MFVMKFLFRRTNNFSPFVLLINCLQNNAQWCVWGMEIKTRVWQLFYLDITQTKFGNISAWIGPYSTHSPSTVMWPASLSDKSGSNLNAFTGITSSCGLVTWTPEDNPKRICNKIKYLYYWFLEAFHKG